MKIVICANTAWNLINFRKGLICALLENGYEVVAIASDDKYSKDLMSIGCKFIPVDMHSSGTNPVQDTILIFQIFQILSRERPNIYLGFTIKPNIYGSLVAGFLKIPVINNIAGLGIVFGKSGLLKIIVRKMYRLALSRSHMIFFQNRSDQSIFIIDALVRAEVTALLPGSGVDLERFRVMQLPVCTKEVRKFRFLLIARMLWDKGIGEFAEAAKLIKIHFTNVEFCLLGFLDVDNPNSISNTQMNELVASGLIYLGESDDVRIQIAEADCVVLPSYYREGTPRSLLEGASMARPIITTDTPGCRDVVDHGINGYLCKVRDARDLANKMLDLLLLPVEERIIMGLKGSEKIKVEFDEKIVINKYLDNIKSAIN